MEDIKTKKRFAGYALAVVFLALAVVSSSAYIQGAINDASNEAYIAGRFDVIEYPHGDECVVIISHDDAHNSFTRSSRCWFDVCYEKIYADCDEIHEMLKGHDEVFEVLK